MAFTLGQTVGDYRIIDVIGSGGMGTVYKVRHLISDRIEAMKVILPNLIDSTDLAERFIREIRVQARLSHPNIASLHNALRLDQQLLMVMEYIDGTTLYTQLRESGLDTSRCLDIVLQVLSALAYAHEQAVVHRDIKPGNIMLTPGGTVKIMDFGIARSLAETNDLTRTGAAIGSLYYMSPEQVQGRPVDKRSDLYSVGVMLYEMVTGAKPITGDTSWAIMNAHVNQVPRAPAALNGSIPASLSLAILKALEKDPVARYQSASEFAEILRAIRARCSIKSPPPAEHDAMVVLPRRSDEPATAPDRVPARQDVIASALATPMPAPRSGPTPENTVAPPRFARDELEHVKRELAVYVGPMARIIVDRAAKKSTSWQQLYEILSAEVPSGEERKRFLRTRPR